MAPPAVSPQARLASQHSLLYGLDSPNPVGGDRHHGLGDVADRQGPVRAYTSVLRLGNVLDHDVEKEFYLPKHSVWIRCRAS